MVHVLAAVCVLIPLFFVSVLIQSLLLNFCARSLFGVTIGVPRGVFVVIVAEISRAVFTAIFFGADIGLVGSTVAYIVWVTMLAVLTELNFCQALLIAIIMSIIAMMFWGAVIMVGVLLGIGALATFAAALSVATV